MSCGGPFHPATGDYDHRFDAATCGPCHRAFWDWYRRHSARQWKIRDVAGKVICRIRFYDHAATSIRATDRAA
jgi:hypothetical protein